MDKAYESEYPVMAKHYMWKQTYNRE